MIRLTEKQPVWKDVLPGVRVQFAPMTNKAWRAARRAAAAVLGTVEGELTDDELREDAGDAFSRALIAPAILAWEGVGDAEGEVAEVTPETVSLFLSDPRRFEACDNAYVMPLVLEQAEGNASAGSPNGISPLETPAPITVTSAVQAEGGAKIAPTSRRTRAPKKAKSSGKSSKVADRSSAPASADLSR